MAQKVPVVLNDAESQHVPLGDTDTIRPSDIPLSKDGGNLLETRDDGLYYGITAPADVTNLYVDSSSGSDTNPGSKLLPLKTLAAAFAKVSSSQSNTIWLKAGLEYTLPSFNVNGGATRVVRVYGDPHVDGDKVPTTSPEIPHYYSEIVDELNRPTIRPYVNYNTTNHTYSIGSGNVQNGGTVTFLGIHLDAKPVNDVDSGDASVPSDFDNTWGRYNTGMIYGNAEGTLQLRGCTYLTPKCPAIINSDEQSPWWTITDTGAEGGMPAVQFNRSQWLDGGNKRLLGASAAGASIYVTNWPTNPAAYTAQYPDITPNLTTKLIVDGAVSGIVEDSDGKPRNLVSNLVF